MILSLLKWFRETFYRSDSDAENESLKKNSALDLKFFPKSYYQRVYMNSEIYYKIIFNEGIVLTLSDYRRYFLNSGIQTLFDCIVDEMFEINSEESEFIAKLTLWRLKDDRFGENMFKSFSGQKLKYFLHHYHRALHQLHKETGNWSFDPLSLVMSECYSPLHESFKEGNFEMLSIILNSGYRLEFNDTKRLFYTSFSCNRGQRRIANFEYLIRINTFLTIRKYLRTLEKRKRIDDNSTIYKLSDLCFQVEDRETERHDRFKAFQEIFFCLKEASLADMSEEFENRHATTTRKCSLQVRRNFLILQTLHAFASNYCEQKRMLETLDLIWRSIPDTYVNPFELMNILYEGRYFVKKESVSLTQEEYAKSEILGYNNIANPRSLKHLCRCEIRHCLAKNHQLPNGVHALIMPSELKSFLLLER
ncbi:uncharacterized protein [Parasteatoda tepidariorum]|nr:uncharacterized protein LOC107444972 [Parasteatoda tepidariorum]